MSDFLANLSYLKYLLVLFIVINVIVLLLFLCDKQKSIKQQRRISERTLMLASLVGGIGAFIGVFFIRHKSRKIKFKVTVFIGLLLAVAAIIHFVHTGLIGQKVRFIENSFYSES